MMTSALYQDLLQYDGKAVTLLSEARARYGRSEGFLSELATLCAAPEPMVASGASWILAEELKGGAQLGAEDLRALIAALPQLTHWSAALHLLQSLAHQRIEAAEAKALAHWAEGYAQHKRPFLRAWSAHLIVQLAAEHPALRPMAEAAIARAGADSAASVRARARHLKPA